MRRRAAHETLDERGRRKFTGGVLEQGANILGAVAASVLAVGLIGPYIAAFTGSSHVPPAVLRSVARSAFAFAMLAAVASMVMRGLARRADDDVRFGSGGSAAPHRDLDQ